MVLEVAEMEDGRTWAVKAGTLMLNFRLADVSNQDSKDRLSCSNARAQSFRMRIYVRSLVCEFSRLEVISPGPTRGNDLNL